MVYINILLSFGVFLPSVLCNCKQASQENTDMAFTNMMIPNFLELTENCGDLRNGDTDICSATCNDTVNMMTTVYPWLLECDCQYEITSFYSTDDCLADRKRLPLCFIDNYCSQMYKVCNDSATCRTKLNDYLEYCKEELNMSDTETGCETMMCMNAFDDIQVDPDAAGLWQCECDDKARDWCQSFINRTECTSIYDDEYSDYDQPGLDGPPSQNIVEMNRPPVVSLDTVSSDVTDESLPSCRDEIIAFCGEEFHCQNSIGSDLLELDECDQMNGDIYNCSTKCAMMLRQMKEKYPMLYECDCRNSVVTYHPGVCARDKKRYEYCFSEMTETLYPSCPVFSSCLDELSTCSSLLYSFLTNCSSDMLSRDPDMLCTPQCEEALDRLSNDTEGVTLMQCRCEKEDELCVGFQEGFCVGAMPSESSRLSASFLMTYLVLFVTQFQVTKRSFGEILY